MTSQISRATDSLLLSAAVPHPPHRPAEHLLLLEQNVDAGEVLAVVVRVQLGLQALQPALQGRAALGKQLGSVGIEEAAGLGLGGALQPVPAPVQVLQLLGHQSFQLWLLEGQFPPFLGDGTQKGSASELDVTELYGSVADQGAKGH